AAEHRSAPPAQAPAGAAHPAGSGRRGIHDRRRRHRPATRGSHGPRRRGSADASADRLASASLPHRGPAAPSAGPVVRGDRGVPAPAARHGEGSDPPSPCTAPRPDREAVAMNRCRETRNVQEYLDAELDAERALAFEHHLETCETWLAEVRAFRSLFQTLGDFREERVLLDPGPGLTERILDRVLPSRLRRRLVTVLGWIYGSTTAVTTFAFVSWISRPDSHVWLAQRYGEI